MSPSPDLHPTTALLVLGMHRSGTSATAGSLRLLGVDLGERLIAGAKDNRKGYWEHADAVAIHDRLLLALERSWDDVRPFPSAWSTTPAAALAGKDIAAIVAGFSGSPVWAVKDPRMARLAPLWLREIARAGQRAACLIVVRHPEEVAASLAERNGLPAAVSHLLWIRHVLAAIADSEGIPRQIISFDSLLHDPTRTLEHVGQQLGLAWPVPAATATKQLDAFLERSHKHQAHDASQPASGTTRIAALSDRIYQRCLDVARGDATWADLAGYAEEADRWHDEEACLVETIGKLQHAATLARASDLGRFDAEVQLLRQNITQLESAKAVAETLAHTRLTSLAVLEQRCNEAEQLALSREEALRAAAPITAQAEALALARLDENAALTDALNTAQSLAYQRLEALSQAVAANAELETLALARLREAQQLARALDETRTLAEQRLEELRQEMAVRANVEALALARLQEIQALSRSLQQAEDLARARAQALREAEDLACTRAQALREAEGLASTREKSLCEAEGLASTREQSLRELLTARAALDATVSGLRQALAALTTRLDAAGVREQALLKSLAEADAAHQASVAEVEVLAAELSEITNSVAWRLSTPLRALSRYFGPAGKPK